MKTLGISLGILAVVAVVCAFATADHAATEAPPAPSAQPAAPAAPAAPVPFDANRANEEAKLRARCQNNLKQLGLVFKMFANESKGARFPVLSPQAGHLMFANENPGMNPVYPEYITDLSILICPASKEASLLKDPAKKSDPKVLIDDYSYFYLGYAITNEAELKAFAEAYKERVAKGQKFDEDLTTPNGTLHLLREGVERFFVKDPSNPASSAQVQSEIPVLIERPENHTPTGGNVLFMDGHVEFRRYSENGQFPMSKTAIDTLKALDALKAPAK